MAQHTAGPWHVGVGNGEGSVFANEGRMRLEEAGTTLYPICKVFDFDGDREANARLIAAAPELLRELEELLQWVDGLLVYVHNRHVDVSVNLKTIKDKLDSSYAAICKAKGG